MPVTFETETSAVSTRAVWPEETLAALDGGRHSSDGSAHDHACIISLRSLAVDVTGRFEFPPL